jgi:diguanylate cyclase (GGDEF)-like protein
MSARPRPAIMVVDRSSSYQAQLLAGVLAALRPADVPLVTYTWPSLGGRPAGLRELLHHARPSAVVVTPLSRTDDDERLTAVLAAFPDLPQVHIGVNRGDGSVRADNANGMRLLVDHLLGDCGIRSPLVVRGLGHHPDSDERLDSVQDQLRRRGIESVPVIDGAFEREPAYRAMHAYLATGADVDAVVALNDRSALGCIDALQAMGLRVPQDVVVTGFDNEELSLLSRPMLTTVCQNPAEQGAIAGRMLLRLRGGQRAEHCRVPVSLRVRASTSQTAAAGGLDSTAAEALWTRLSESDTGTANARAVIGCHSLADLGEHLAASLPRLGADRAALLVPDAEPGERSPAEDGAMVLQVEGGRAEVVHLVAAADVTGWVTQRLNALGDSLVLHPLAMNGEEVGFLAVEDGAEGLPEALVLDVARAVAAIRQAAQRDVAQAALLHVARHDPVTGLLNRSAFVVGADRLLERLGSEGLALCLVDVDSFKDVNTSVGHAVGDVLLRQVAARLVAVAGGHDLVFRLGGDEFAVVVRDVRTPGDAIRAAMRVVAALDEPFTQGDVRLEVEGTAGAAGYPWQATDARSLLHMADVALFRAKTDRSQTVLYTREYETEATHRVELFRALRRALAGRQFAVHYQPIVDVHGRRVTGVEALLRWQHPQRGMLGPDHFLDVAEQTGLIRPITTFVLDQAFGDCRRWLDQGLALRTAVNLSARWLADDALTGSVAALLTRHALSPDRVELEITESAAMIDPVAAQAVLTDLRLLGVDLSVDDFGTGHASLSYLSRLPVTTLKIDRSFVNGMTGDTVSRTIVRSVVDLARDLALAVVAEGVEDRCTFDALASIDRSASLRAQGFWLARPVPVEELPDVASQLAARLSAGRIGRRCPPRPRDPQAPLSAETAGGRGA